MDFLIVIVVVLVAVILLSRLTKGNKGTDSPPKNRKQPQRAPASPTQPDDILNQTFRFVAVDVETANSDTSSICQLGLALVTDSGHIHTISFLIDPEMQFGDFNVNLHGIDEQAVQGYPTFAIVIQELRAFLNRHPLIQHSQFDKRAIEGACARYGLARPSFQWHDSVRIAQRAWPDLKGKGGGHGLANLKNALDLDFQHHDAAEDAKAAAQVVLLAEAKTGQSFSEITATSPRSIKSKGATKSKGTAKPYEKSVAVEGNQNGALFGHIACFTGKLSFSRTEAATIAAGAGITVKVSVSKKVTLLVVGDQDIALTNGNEKSTKHRRADELIAQGHELRILGETEFLSLIRG